MPMTDPLAIPIIVNCRDRVTPLRELVGWLESAGHTRIIFLDNQSTYGPLLEYYRQTPHTVRLLPHNFGARSLWLSCQEELGDWYVYTDPDVLPVEDCPSDLVAELRDILDEFPRVPKAGPSLCIDDLPASFDPEIINWERALTSPLRRLHRRKGDPVFLSKIDTTFALHRPHVQFTYSAIRTGPPYQMRHTSWYTEGQPLSVEDNFYLSRATKGPLGTSWGRRA